MKRIYPTLDRQTPEEQNKSGFYNPAQVLVLKRPKARVTLKCGTSDHNVFWRRQSAQGVTVIQHMSTNPRLGYAGLAEYGVTPAFERGDAPEVEEVSAAFFQSELPDEFFDWSPAKQANYLSDYL